MRDKNNDAYVAKSLAKRFDLKHEYFVTDISNEPIEKIFKRFLVAGEGRVDHISGYMDGFRIWKLLFEEGVSGIIRSDEGFGWIPVSTSSDVRRCIGASLLSDYSNLESPDEFDLEKQTWPKNLQKKEKESLATWRDRLYHEFRIPVVLAALTDLKCPYVELINPLLSRRIIEQVRRIPDSLRTNRSLYKKTVYSMSPKIRFAKYAAIAKPKDILKTPQIINLISNELNATYVKKLLSGKFIDYILDNIEVVDAVSAKNKRYEFPAKFKPLRAIVKHFMPPSLEKKLRNTVLKPKMDYNVLAFRAYIICKMNQILCADANVLNQNH